MRRVLLLVTALAAVTTPSATVAVGSAEAPVTRDHLLTLDDYATVYPDLDDPLRITLRSPVLAPRGCEDQAQAVRGASRILGSVSPVVRDRSVALIEQNLVRFGSESRATALVQRYRHFSRRCVGDVDTDDGEGSAVRLRNRAWFPPRVGDQSAGMLIGWSQAGATDWRRVLVVRVGRTVSVLGVSVTSARPRKDDVVALGELTAERLR